MHYRCQEGFIPFLKHIAQLLYVTLWHGDSGVVISMIRFVSYVICVFIKVLDKAITCFYTITAHNSYGPYSYFVAGLS